MACLVSSRLRRLSARSIMKHVCRNMSHQCVLKCVECILECVSDIHLSVPTVEFCRLMISYDGLGRTYATLCHILPDPSRLQVL